MVWMRRDSQTGFQFWSITYENINVNVLIITDVFYHRRHSDELIFLSLSLIRSLFFSASLADTFRTSIHTYKFIYTNCEDTQSHQLCCALYSCRLNECKSSEIICLNHFFASAFIPFEWHSKKFHHFLTFSIIPGTIGFFYCAKRNHEIYIENKSSQWRQKNLQM